MTSQVKRFIDFEDITAFRFRCTADNCGAELSLPLQGSLARTTAANRCPNCNNPWLLMTDGTSGSGVAQNLDRIVQAMKAISDWGGKCEVTFEIKPDASAPGKGYGPDDPDACVEPDHASGLKTCHTKGY